MNELVRQVEISLSKKVPSVKMPYFVGMSIGYAFDVISKATRKKIAISSVRVKKFCAKTQFNAEKVHSNFDALYSFSDDLDKTLKFEFKSKKEDDVFFTE